MQTIVETSERNPVAPPTTPRPATSKGMLWTGRVISFLFGAFLLFDGVMKLFKPAVVVEGTIKYGYPENTIIPMGIALIASAVLYLIPQTAILGAILLTGYLGGAVATHVQAAEGAFPILFPAIFGAALWFGIYLRDFRLRSALAWKR